MLDTNTITTIEPDIRQRVDALETHLAQLPQCEFPTRHDFLPFAYVRSIAIPAGSALVGKIHKTDHIFMVTKGDISITTDEGVKRVQAGYQAICKAGMKRAGYAHEDTVCINIHITPITDLDELESALIEPPQTAAITDSAEGELCLG